jgi:hypothetical protein
MDVCLIYYSLVDLFTFIIRFEQYVTANWTHCVRDQTTGTQNHDPQTNTHSLLTPSIRWHENPTAVNSMLLISLAIKLLNTLRHPTCDTTSHNNAIKLCLTGT